MSQDTHEDSRQDQRLNELESRVAHQNHTIHALGDEIYLHQKKLDHLEATCNFLLAQLKTQQGVSMASDTSDEKPPHY